MESSRKLSPSVRATLASEGRQASMPPETPWALLGPLASGGFCDVYRAAPRGADRSACYALKMLRPEWRDHSAAWELMRREALVGSKVANPHVVSVLDWSVRQSPCYVVMPLLEGETLAARLKRCTPPLGTALWVARQIATGLEAMHQEGWMHSDVKPANVFLSPDGHATLLDLACAQSLSTHGSIAQRPVVGTLDYIAPEALTSAFAADARSDIYSLGVVLYELLTGRLPYEGRGPAEAALLQREGVPDRLRCLAPTLPLDVVHLVRQMLAKEPLRRPQSPGEVVQRLVAMEIATLPERVPA
jgi:serine/threonine-protein kinase